MNKNIFFNRLGYFIFLVSLSFSACKTSAPTNENFFDGFNKMDVPRTDIPIGAFWTVSGPIGGGVETNQTIESNSFNEYSLTKNINLKTDLEIEILSYIGLNSGFKNISNVQLQLKSITIVRVNDIEVLKKNIGNEILYEGIKAGELTFIVDKDNSSEFKANLSETFEDLSILSESEFGTKKKITTKGTNLFLAYRIVKLERKKSTNKKVKFTRQTNVAEVGNTIYGEFTDTYYCKYKNYTISICPCEVLSCANEKLRQNKDNPKLINKMAGSWMTDCLDNNAWNIQVIDRNDFSNGRPKEVTFKEKLPFDLWNVTIPLKNTIGTNGIEIDYLNIEHLYLLPHLWFNVSFKLEKGNQERVTIIKERIKLKNVNTTVKNGW